jgi:glucan 1,3-beta-glucosidase
MGFEPVNEPLGGTDLGLLKWYYQNVRQVLRTYREDAIFIFHESYHFDAETWNSLFSDADMDNVVLDTHQYICFGAKFEEDIMTHCDNYRDSLKPAKDIKYPVWVGEWSLATDTCAHWLNGFNDHRDDYAYECQMVDCPYSYLPGDLAVDFDRTADILGPFGGSTTLGAIQKGQCYNDSAYFSDDEVMQLAKCMLDAFDEFVDGQFIWTAHNEIETKWDYIRAYDKGFLNQDNTMSNFSGIFTQ